MARLIFNGGEEGTAGNTVLTDLYWTGVSGGSLVTYSNTANRRHSGAVSIRMATVAAGANALKSLAANKSTGTCWVRAYVIWEDMPAAAAPEIMVCRSGSGTTNWRIAILSSGKLRIVNVAGGTINTDGTATYVADTLYRLEFEHVLGEPTSGSLTLKTYLGDSMTEIESFGPSGVDTLATNVREFYWGQQTTGNTMEVFFDDMAVNDETGSTDNTWCGPGNISIAVPSSNVANAWNDAGTGYIDIDDLPGAPVDADYNEEATAGLVGQFGMTIQGTSPPSNAVFKLVGVFGRVGSNQTGNTRMRFKLWDESATLTDGPSCQANVNGWKIVSTAEQLVYSAIGKTLANIINFNVGYETITDATPRRVSALWASLEWTESGEQHDQFVKILFRPSP